MICDAEKFIQWQKLILKKKLKTLNEKNNVYFSKKVVQNVVNKTNSKNEHLGMLNYVSGISKKLNFQNRLRNRNVKFTLNKRIKQIKFPSSKNTKNKFNYKSYTLKKYHPYILKNENIIKNKKLEFSSSFPAHPQNHQNKSCENIKNSLMAQTLRSVAPFFSSPISSHFHNKSANKNDNLIVKIHQNKRSTLSSNHHKGCYHRSTKTQQFSSNNSLKPQQNPRMFLVGLSFLLFLVCPHVDGKFN